MPGLTSGRLTGRIRRLSLKVWITLLLPVSLLCVFSVFSLVQQVWTAYESRFYPLVTVQEGTNGSPGDVTYVTWSGDPASGMTMKRMRQIGADTWGYRMMNRLFPVISIVLTGLSLFGLAVLFYRLKLRRPLLELRSGIERLRRQDLDFTIRYRSGDELGDLCAAFEEMRGQLDAAFKELWDAQESQRRMIQAFAHDLRTPLTVLKGCSDLIGLQTDKGSLSLETVKRNTQLMKENILRMERYADSLREMRSYEEWELKPETVGLTEWCRKLESQWTLLAKPARIRLAVICRGGGYAEVDSALLGRVLDNVAGNALRYASSRVDITLDLRDAGLQIKVEDDGPGFSPESLRRGFEPFYRADAARGTGLGLGLTIARSLTKRHGGNMSLRNIEAGASVLLRVPCRLYPALSAEC
ncbi:HAMP domain-containing sensor histidine kinase [Paenibacillus durus]|uniref:histidine kinase n=1 Tax=Paenibacillus durus TaxID=44251 RepID=A0A089HFG8_PAEDU|nr:HAMP domain-containing sensor histidine kinase [Paenibacillus durus]AIQ10691.1 hypothetical protein PDUR_00535 [Paenibacillus durus]